MSPVAWRTPPRGYGAWETVAGNIAEGLVRRGWENVTLFATKDSITKARLHAVIERGYEEDKGQDPKVVEILHISELMEMADQFDLIHNSYDFIPLTYSRLIDPPMVTTIHGFSSDKIRAVYHKYKHDSYYVSISDSDRDSELPYLATVYNGIDLSNITFRENPGDKLVFLGRIHPDKGVHLACQAAKTLPTVALAPDRLRQVVLNLAINAIDATPEGGVVRLEARASDRGVLVVVSDRGPGIPEDLRSRVFEPFFSGRNDRPGGLGLAISRRIAEEAGGTLEARDATGGGAAFHLDLPASDN